jgi:hypothetical protein
MLCVTATPIVRGPEYARFNELWRSAVHRARLIAALICFTGLLPGCVGKKAEVTPGEVLHVREEFEFFFQKDSDRYAFPPLAEVQSLFIDDRVVV